ncbi:single-stranded DNA-binding protein [Brevibacillus halotolerans]|uniref:single-stranded DNA-binding protein n=1 Tax=Brevibacillus TaxID=55080 RepID=UPI00215BA50D|nr:single-stranded DNA-binding protein [Brevibacillus laterosporus]MCR8961633.1 single-stranded DNA-binding protein [Brevibacillus laterosporus]MCZ0833788.1 single-stranded DNA-binding protein [Brevibacillus halotolerans]
MLNRVILIGNLTKDPELRYTPNDVAVTTFTLAINRPYSGAGKEVDYINIVAWRQLADLCAQYLAKGKKCAVEGRLQTRTYDNKEGRKVYVTEVVAESTEFLSYKDGQAQQSNGQSFNASFSGNKTINITDDDLPF